MKAVQAGLLYFVSVFGCAFALGFLRVLLVVPLVGARAAEFLEFPWLFAVMTVANSKIQKRLLVGGSTAERAIMGFTGLVLTLAVEFTAMLRLRNLSFEQYLEEKDPVTSTVFYLLLLVYGCLPVFIKAN
jgi:hypothetical protein